jgi:hypothetical protein
MVGLPALLGCSSAPKQQMQPIEKVASTCDREQMDRVERVQQPYLLGRQWVNCPQKSDKAKPPPS